MRARKVFSRIKHLFLGSGRKPRRIWSGAYRNLKMRLDPASQSQCVMGFYEREIHRWLQPLVDNAKSAIDIGTGSGELALYFLMHSKIEKLFTFDPKLVDYQEFQHNLALNSLQNDTRLESSTKYVKSSCDDNSVTLDSLIPKLKFPCAIKIDVDGAEVDILDGAKELIQTGQTRWLIEVHSKELEVECIKRLSESGYKVTIIPNAWWRFLLPEERPIEHNRWIVAFPVK